MPSASTKLGGFAALFSRSGHGCLLTHKLHDSPIPK